MSSSKKELFSCSNPCGNCPYRTDAPTGFWAKEEFENLLKTENSQLGRIYLCHKKNGSICVGWLMNQDERGTPSIALRMTLIDKEIGRDYLDSLSSPHPLFSSVAEMVENNFPELLIS